MVARFLSLVLLIGSVHAQAIYCGLDNNLSDKVTLSNLCTYSEQFNNAAWTKFRTTVTANSVIAPDGTLTADTIANTATTGSHGAYSAAAVVVPGTTYRLSVYLKKGTYDYVVLRSQAPGTSYVGVNLASGKIEAVGSTTLSSSILAVGNGWYRVSFTHVKGAGTSEFLTLNLVPSGYDANSNWDGTTNQYIYAWGASIQLASASADYLATTSAASTLAGVCGSYQTPSSLDPSKCISMSNRGREIRTEAQIAIGSQ